ncbi:hypothetical protein D3C73_1265550 [compost metagenome]
MHVHRADSPGQFEAVHHQLTRKRRRQLVSPLIQVHVGVQASRLLHAALVLAGGRELIQWDGIGCVEAESVKVRAADAVLFNNCVRAIAAEP